MHSVITVVELRTDAAWRLVAEVAGTHAATLLLERTGPEATVRSIAVDTGFERLGLAGELLDAAVELARRAGARVLTATCAPGDRATKALLEGAGLRAVELRLARPLA